VLGLAVAGAMWWAYFDVTSILTEHALAEATGERQIRLARGGYTFLHLPMVIGIVLMSLGLKKELLYIGGGEGHTLADPIHGIPLAALYGGAAIYLLAHVWFKAYLVGSVNVGRIVVGVGLLAITPLVAMVPAVVALLILALVLCGVVGYETHHFRELRHQVRHGQPGHAEH
jgi:low temperature requirement protein LtrA